MVITFLDYFCIDNIQQAMATVQVSEDHFVMKTPTKVIIYPIRVEECQIQPVLMCKSKSHKNIYRLKDEGAVVLETKDKKEVEIDRHLLKRVVSFSLTGEGKTIENNEVDIQESNGLSEHFAAITARPKRVAIRRLPSKPLKNNIFRNFSEGGIIPRPKKLALRSSNNVFSDFPMMKRKLFSNYSEDDSGEGQQDLKNLLELSSVDEVGGPTVKRFKL